MILFEAFECSTASKKGLKPIQERRIA